MNITLTGSLGNIGRPLVQALVRNGHAVTVISNNTNKQKEIEALGAGAAIGSIMDGDFISAAFKGADIVYLMEVFEAAGSLFDKSIDFATGTNKIAENYKRSVLEGGIKKVVHLSSIGGHTDKGNGILSLHHNVEQILKTLPEDVSIKCMRPVGFYTNLLRSIQNIKTKNAIIQNFGGDRKEPWVSPLDIASVIAEEIEKPFQGRSFRYIASDEVSPNEIAKVLGEAINMPELKWIEITDEQMLNGMLSAGMNEQIATGFVAMQAAQRDGTVYDDYNKNRPALGKVKLTDYARDFAKVYHQS